MDNEATGRKGAPTKANLPITEAEDPVIRLEDEDKAISEGEEIRLQIRVSRPGEVISKAGTE